MPIKKKKNVKKPPINVSLDLKYINDHNLDNETIISHKINVITFKNVIKMIDRDDHVKDNHYELKIIKIVDKNLDVAPFWNFKIQDLSKQLFMPSTNNIKKYNKYIDTFNYDNWFNVSKYLPIKNIVNDKFDYIDNKYTEKMLYKTKKIKIYFNDKQQRNFYNIVGTYRYFYNRCVDFFKNYKKEENKSFYYVYPNEKDENNKQKIEVKIKDDKSIYKDFNTYKYLEGNNPKWIMNKYPAHLIRVAIKECCDRMKTCFTNLKRHKQKFNLSYKTKKDLIQTINIEGQMITKFKENKRVITNKINLFPNLMIDDEYVYRDIKLAEEYPTNYVDSSISYHQVLKEFYINFNYEEKTTNTVSDKICSIDQGIRTPFTIFDKDQVVTIGDQCTRVLMKRCKEVDIITSRLNKMQYYIKNKDGVKIYHMLNNNVRRNLRKALHRKIKKIQNMKKELHNKTIKYLTDNYKCIILPPFNVKQMSARLSSKIARNMLTLSFYQFKVKLKLKALAKNVRIAEFNEPYTSKTCGNCGSINNELKNSKIFKCPACNIELDRDINGARNIMLRNYNSVIATRK